MKLKDIRINKEILQLNLININLSSLSYTLKIYLKKKDKLNCNIVAKNMCANFEIIKK